MNNGDNNALSNSFVCTVRRARDKCILHGVLPYGGKRFGVGADNAPRHGMNPRGA